MRTLYTAHVTTIIGKESHAYSDDKQLIVGLSKPGDSLPGTNPEQLLAAGYGACFGMTIRAIAQTKKLPVDAIHVLADVNLLDEESGARSFSIILDVSVIGVDEATAQQLAESAHAHCPFSKSLAGNVVVTTNVHTAVAEKAA